MLSSFNVFHLGLKSEDIQGATLAILTGDPNRVRKIALLMENPKYLFSCREFTVWTARIDKSNIIVCSTGIGGPSMSIAVEELAQLGIRTFLRVGTAGAIQEYIKVGDALVITAAVRCDGASKHFAPVEFPAVGDLSCSMALIRAAEMVGGVKTYSGITVSSDTFYSGQERKNTYSKYVIKSLSGSMKEWKQLEVMSYEMESSTLFTMCASQKGLRAGVIVGIIVNRIQAEIPINTDFISDIEDIVINIVIKGAQILLSSCDNIV